MKYENVKTMGIGEQVAFNTKDYPKITAEVLAQRISSFSATLRKDPLYKDFRIRTVTTPFGIIVIRIS